MVFDLNVDEIFKVDHEWYGVLKSQRDPSFKRYVRVLFRSHRYEWESLNETEENVIRRIYERRSTG
ncbi:hypothetical protein IMZ31_22825 (plasmid) [Pontibacillus sp. ALD_SL1]|uniref:hypothetical protein n=1 Tax=Pontibacillus sp. ALD_SL1 TaxID=2777185 RepID=UPI001A95ACFB|nr:hypothetical protein [Pontibacillus sp. ALD_SL1]QST02290.1 hypothetical protein IMZ31_22825 [Pontibacillus sp. ALD_SL1]